MNTHLVWKLCLAAGVVGSLLTAWRGYSFMARRQEAIELVKNNVQSEAAEAARRIDDDLRRLASRVEALSTAEPSKREAGLEGLLDDNPLALEAGIIRNGSVRTARARDGSRRVFGDMVTSGWSEPFWVQDLSAPVVLYVTEAYAPDELVYAAISGDTIGASVALDTGSTGWGFLLSQEGRMIVHPSRALLRSRITVFELAQREQDESIAEIARRALAGENGFVDRTNLMTGQASWLFYEPVPAAGWSLGVVQIQDEILVRRPKGRRDVIRLSILGTASISIGLLGSALLGSWFRSRPRETLWSLVAAVSLVLFSGGTVMRLLVYSETRAAAPGSTRILDPSALASFLESRELELRRADAAEPAYVRAGVLLQNLEFKSPKDLFVTGFAWQKFSPLQKELTPGFVLPDAVSSSFRKSLSKGRGGGADGRLVHRGHHPAAARPFQVSTGPRRRLHSTLASGLRAERRSRSRSRFLRRHESDGPSGPG